MTIEGNEAAQRQRRVTARAVSEDRRQATALITGAAATFGYIPQNAGLYVRISDDPYGEERGVTRQAEDGHTRADQLGWTIGVEYCENDTSAYRKRKVTLPDGSVAWRVFRPEFRRMLDDLYHGRIDGIIVVDQDRLLRQPRDLEDLIDIVEYTRRPVTGITSQINLMTSEGRAMARMMAAIALKSSEDTARRVSRAKLEDAVEGKARAVRRFGWTMAGEIIPEEAKAAQDAAAIVINTGSWHSATKALQDGDVPPVKGGRWNLNTVRNMLLSPTIAGIALYRGMMRPETGGKPNAADPAADAIKDVDGQYITNGLKAVLEVEVWEALCQRVKDAHEGKAPGIPTTRKYLLSGMLRCANVREDGTVCGTPMVGTVIKRTKKSAPTVIYKCPGKTQGGCAGIFRQAAPVDELVTDLLFRHLRRKAPRTPMPTPTPRPNDSPEAERLTLLRQRAAAIREGYAGGDKNVTDETFFSTLPKMEAEIKALATRVEAQAPTTEPTATADEVIAEWKQADIAGKRAILARYLIAVKVSKSASRGRAPFDHNAITPIWKKTPAKR